MRFPAKMTSSCIWVAIPVDWLILHRCGRTVGRAYGHVITKFSYPWCSAARPSRARTPLWNAKVVGFNYCITVGIFLIVVMLFASNCLIHLNIFWDDPKMRNPKIFKPTCKKLSVTVLSNWIHFQSCCLVCLLKLQCSCDNAVLLIKLIVLTKSVFLLPDFNLQVFIGEASSFTVS